MRDLRSTYGTNLAHPGNHPQVSRKLMGHSRIDTTMAYYTGVVPSDLRNAADSMEAMHGQQRQKRQAS